jgi:hypothetical protein
MAIAFKNDEMSIMFASKKKVWASMNRIREIALKNCIEEGVKKN